MNPEKLKEAVLKAEGYAQGFKDGFIACAKGVAEELAKEQKSKEEMTGA